ncbi:MAG: two pore domain potassium channel family protein [Rhodanobacteraceae bacterium]|nr:two pore domain potassium channel family protein [Rhodanobacteraceae bacterium]MBP9153374.1 two pore domain potassium channel family protein [Xanthomonadales bacterium]HQW81204.1 potassium channel family protein [Pseudomonadota bacterium]
MVIRARFGAWLGLAGVAPDEPASARRVSRWFEWVLVPLALWLPIQWSLESNGQIPVTAARAVDWLTWILFVAEAAIVGALVTDRTRYFRGNWLNLLIIVIGLPLLWDQGAWARAARALRLLLMVSLLTNLARVVRHMLSQNRLGPILAAIVIVTTLGGAVIGYFDPAFSRPMDGIWWAWVTVTTVGYGDMVPQTPAARIFAVTLMLLGVSMIALLSASLVAFFQEDEDREARHLRHMIWMKLQHMEEDAEARAKHNEVLLARLAAIEVALLKAVEERSTLERKVEQLFGHAAVPIADDGPKDSAPGTGPVAMILNPPSDDA